MTKDRMINDFKKGLLEHLSASIEGEMTKKTEHKSRWTARSFEEWLNFDQRLLELEKQVKELQTDKRCDCGCGNDAATILTNHDQNPQKHEHRFDDHFLGEIYQCRCKAVMIEGGGSLGWYIPEPEQEEEE